jgi:hypoxanthine-DNA glycosylase
MRLTGLPPLIGDRPRVLLLGSFPSVASLEHQCYYGHPRNHLWGILGEILGAPAPFAWPGRADWLTSNGVAVWDVVGSCLREGSLDQNVREAVVNDIPALVRSLPTLQVLALNGGLAAKTFDKHFPQFKQDFTGIRVVALPSSSPIPTARYRCLVDKIEMWREAFALPDA